MIRRETDGGAARICPTLLSLRAVLVAMMFLFAHAIPVSRVSAQPALETVRYPLSKTDVRRTPIFILDSSEVASNTQSIKWGENAKELCEEWFPVLCKFLVTEDWNPPETVRLVVKKELNIPGVRSGNTISVSDKWITEHPEDFGMVIHELVHVIQDYPPSKTNPGWLVEGIADYLRYWKYESEAPRQKPHANASYRDGYGTTGAFLSWIVWKYDRRLVRRLDSALRKNEYKDSIFQELTGKELPALWDEYVKDEQRHGK